MKQAVVDYIKQCPVCQINKAEHCKYPGLLQPLPVPDFAWCHISMNFVEGLPTSNNKDLILVVVDRFTKYSHFIAMKHPITVSSVARAFVDNIFKLHGLPSVIVTDRDKIFTSNLWQELFKKLGIKLHLSTSYHPQSDGQTERVNQCMENYLRCMAFLKPTKWHQWLSLAEWWYNTSFHTALQITPFQALYNRKPQMLAEAALYPEDSTDTLPSVLTAEQTANQIKGNLLTTQERMKHYADKKRSERSLEVGDMVYLKLQPYRHTTLSIHRCLKLHSKYYGPFKVLQKIGKVAYKLLLPEDCKLHHTFHISQLKKHIGPTAVPNPKLPLINPDGTILLEPEMLLEIKLVPRTQGTSTYQWYAGRSSGPTCHCRTQPGRMPSSSRRCFLSFSPEDRSGLAREELSGPCMLYLFCSRSFS